MSEAERATVLMVIIAMLLGTVIVFRVAACAEKPNRMDGSIERQL